MRLALGSAPLPKGRPEIQTHRILPILNAVRADKQLDQADSSTLQLIASIMEKANEEHARLLAAGKPEGVYDSQAAEEGSLRSKVLQCIQGLQEGLLERGTEVRLLLLTALAGEHLLLLGPPGTAKSELSRRLSKLTGGRYFERLLTRFSVPEELFGPLSMKGLENDEYVRHTDGYLPTAEVAFIDEIFKANSAILNALLTLLNERLFDNGNKRFPVPLLCMVGASNELPESEELDALFDRFLLRRHVSQVSSAQLASLARLAANSQARQQSSSASNGNGGAAAPSAAASPLTLDDFKSTSQAAHSSVDLPESVVDLLTGLRDYLQDKCEPPVYVSDRRFMKAVNLLQVAAFADSRDEVSEYDCLLLEHVFGNRPDDAQKVKAWILETIASDPGLQQVELVFLGLFGRACRVLEAPTQEELAETRQETADLVELLSGRATELARTLDADFPDLRSSVWLAEAAAQSSVQSLTPQMTENRARAEDLLREALVLQEALKQDPVVPGLLERLLPKRFKQYQKGISSRT